MMKCMKQGDLMTLRSGNRVVIVMSKPRRVAGGEAVTVAWEADDQTQKLSDGSVHPVHRAGWQWEEPVGNLHHVVSVAS